MMSRHCWITAFVGRVLREGHCVDPDRAFDAADAIYLDSRAFDPELVADSSFGAFEARRRSAPSDSADDTRARTRDPDRGREPSRA